MEWGVLQVGGKFPANYRKYDSAALALDGPTFNVVLSVGGITPKEAQSFCKGKLRIGAAVVASIPFVLIDCPGLATFDAPLNILVESQKSRDGFLAGEPEANLVSLFLVDNRTDIIRGMRSVGCTIDFMRTIKEAAFDQAAKYATADEVIKQIQAISTEYSTDRLIKRAVMQVFK